MPSFTNSARVDSRVKFYDTLDQERGRNTAYRVLQGVAQSKNLLVFCGSGISVDAGLPTFQDQARSSEVVPSTPISWNNFLSEFTVPKPSPAQINVINKATTAYRIMARQATPTNFHRFVQRKMDLGECSRCITRNFDGLETRDRSDLSSRVTMLHGDNNTLRCSVLRCSSVQGEQVASFDARFLEGETVSCPSCEESAKKNTRSRIRPGPLQANLLLDGRIDPNVEREQLLAEARNADTLLIAGTNIDTIDIYSFVEELVQTVRRKAGVIVFINSANIITTKLAHLIDFYLQLDVQACAETLFYIMKEDNNECGQAVWDEFAEPTLESAIVPAEDPCTDEMCIQCNLRLPKMLIKCTASGCGRAFCYEAPGTWMGNTCLALHSLVAPGPEDTLDTIKEVFKCYECFDHSGEAIYPHLMRQPRFFYDAPIQAPRLLLAVYYLSQFYPDAEHTMLAIANSWTLQGWECAYWPIPFHLLDGKRTPDFHVSWPAGSYNMMVVYITHGVSDNYQINDTLGVEPQQFLKQTTTPISGFIKGATTCVSFILACGKVYDDPRNMAQIQQWIEQEDNFHSVVGTLNRRLSPAYMVDLLCQVAVDLLGYSTWKWELLIDLWLRNTLANGHTDLIYFERHNRPRAFLFSPFQTRPLGIPLPPILNACPCRPGSEEKKRKVWKVQHTGVARKEIGKVVIRVECSVCEKVWHLQKPRLNGLLWTCGGLYASILTNLC